MKIQKQPKQIKGTELKQKTAVSFLPFTVRVPAPPCFRGVVTY